MFTNLAAAQNLRVAAQACARQPDLARSLGVDLEEQATWRDAAAAVVVPYDEDLRVHQQCEGFTQRPEWDFAAHREYPLLLHSPYFDLYRRQVVKQADLQMALFWFPDVFTAEEKARAVDYYERRTVRDSSLSAAVQAITAAEVGHLELAHDYLYEAATVDLRDLHHNTGDGLHMASLAGTWLALVHGFGGMRDTGGALRFDPHLPSGVSRLRFTIRWRQAKLCVDVRPDAVTYTVRDHGSSIDLRHGEEELTVHSGEPVTRPLTHPLGPAAPPPRAAARPRPAPPRAPHLTSPADRPFPRGRGGQARVKVAVIAVWRSPSARGRRPCAGPGRRRRRPGPPPSATGPRRSRRPRPRSRPRGPGR